MSNIDSIVSIINECRKEKKHILIFCGLSVDVVGIIFEYYINSKKRFVNIQLLSKQVIDYMDSYRYIIIRRLEIIYRKSLGTKLYYNSIQECINGYTVLIRFDDRTAVKLRFNMISKKFYLYGVMYWYDWYNMEKMNKLNVWSIATDIFVKIKKTIEECNSHNNLKEIMTEYESRRYVQHYEKYTDELFNRVCF